MSAAAPLAQGTRPVRDGTAMIYQKKDGALQHSVETHQFEFRVRDEIDIGADEVV